MSSGTGNEDLQATFLGYVLGYPGLVSVLLTTGPQSINAKEKFNKQK